MLNSTLQSTVINSTSISQSVSQSWYYAAYHHRSLCCGWTCGTGEGTCRVFHVVLQGEQRHTDPLLHFTNTHLSQFTEHNKADNQIDERIGYEELHAVSE